MSQELICQCLKEHKEGVLMVDLIVILNISKNSITHNISQLKKYNEISVVVEYQPGSKVKIHRYFDKENLRLLKINEVKRIDEMRSRCIGM